MQFDLFAAETPQPVDLRSTKLPDLTAAAARVGSAEQWQTFTLSQVLELWNDLYSDFVAALEGPIHYAMSFLKEKGENYGKGGPSARKFYQGEYERLVQGQRQLHATVENLFSDNMLVLITQGKALLTASGLDEDEAEDSHEFFNEVIQRPGTQDLGKLMPVLMQDLAEEYLRLEACETT